MFFLLKLLVPWDNSSYWILYLLIINPPNQTGSKSNRNSNFLAYNFNVFEQMGAVEPSFEEVPNIFDTGGAKGLPGDSVKRLPKIKVTNNNNVDASGEKACCSVCLQVTSSD